MKQTIKQIWDNRYPEKITREYNPGETFISEKNGYLYIHTIDCCVYGEGNIVRGLNLLTTGVCKYPVRITVGGKVTTPEVSILLEGGSA